VSRRKISKIQVRLGEHAEARWVERAKRRPGKLADLIAMLLIERLGIGLTVHHNRVLLPLDARKLSLPEDLIACIDLPDWRGVWKVVTFFHRGVSIEDSRKLYRENRPF
jgi:hypothetical protein